MAKKPTILLRNGWQSFNIGDIGHWMGALSLIRRYIPEAHVYLWPIADLDQSTALLDNYDNVEMVHGRIEKNGSCNPWLREIIEASDFLLHGSGASISVGALEGWRAATDKPYGCLGVSFTGGRYGTLFADRLAPEVVDTLSGAEFIYTRETDTLRFLKNQGVAGPSLDFVPDTTFAFDTPDTAKADDYLSLHSLEDEQFMVVLPKLRIDPYWRYRATTTPIAEVEEREAVNARWRGYDNGFLCEAIVRWVHETGGRVLICPEMVYEMEVEERDVLPHLDDSVRDHVVCMNRFWLPDEAFAVYRRSRLMVSIEMHSPILSVVAGRPAIHLRQPTDSPKAQMWNDLGFGDWLFPLDQSEPADVVDRMMSIHQDYEGAKDVVRRGVAEAHERHRRAMLQVRSLLGLGEQ